MKVLVWMFTGFDKPTTSEHLLTAIIEKLCQNGHSVHIIQKNCGGNRPAIPECLIQYSITTDQIPFDTVDKGKSCRQGILPSFNTYMRVKSTYGVI